MNIFSFFQGSMGKIFAFALLGLGFFIMKMKLDTANAEIKAHQATINMLQSVNEKQNITIQQLIHEKEKQEKNLLEYEKIKQNLQQQYEEKEKALKKIVDERAITWKKQEIPQSIRTILMHKK